ncbi:hypothetical protein J4233_03755 [Candidatus Pacearchaeota archaeon]|nr:hypothetical protein [Candidatus Pacearchaeota archaeon]
MPKKNKEIEDRLQTIEYLLAGILMKREPNIKEVAKVIGCSDTKLSSLFPDRKKKGKNKLDNEESIDKGDVENNEQIN